MPPAYTPHNFPDILVDTPDYIAVNKPPHLAVIPGRAEPDCLLHALARHLNLPHTGQQDPRLRVVHRLDKDTSGVILFAKNISAQRHFSEQFQNNTVQKQYLAITAGKPSPEQGTIEAPLAVHPTQKDRMTVSRLTPTGRPAKPAVTAYQLESRLGPLSLIRCFPKTGKTHQIRVHLAHIHCPLAIDPLYGSPGDTPILPRKRSQPTTANDDFDPDDLDLTDPNLTAKLTGQFKNNNPDNTSTKPEKPTLGLYLSRFKRNYHPDPRTPERPLISRLTLHAHKLTLTAPDGQPLTLEAPLPKDLRATIAQLSKLRK
jgi:23S rRNA pseudouridine1911/1915/1917 synthase